VYKFWTVRFGVDFRIFLFGNCFGYFPQTFDHPDFADHELKTSELTKLALSFHPRNICRIGPGSHITLDYTIDS
jgi:hypothetical protein